MEAYKETEGKLNYELDFSFIKQLAERMSANKDKYPPYNWKNLDNVEDLKQAMYRHVTEIMQGNYEDDNRLFGHIEALALNCMFINYQLKNKTTQKGILSQMMQDDEKDGFYLPGDEKCDCDPNNPPTYKPYYEPTLDIGDIYRYKNEGLPYILYDIDADNYYFQSKAIKRQVSKEEFNNSPDWTKL